MDNPTGLRERGNVQQHQFPLHRLPSPAETHLVRSITHSLTRSLTHSISAHYDSSSPRLYGGQDTVVASYVASSSSSPLVTDEKTPLSRARAPQRAYVCFRDDDIVDDDVPPQLSNPALRPETSVQGRARGETTRGSRHGTATAKRLMECERTTMEWGVIAVEDAVSWRRGGRKGTGDQIAASCGGGNWVD